MRKFKRLILFCILAAPLLALASVTVTVNGSNHTIPQTNERGWGNAVTAWIQSISQYTLQPTGGTFSLTADADFGSSYGLKSSYLSTRTANPSSAGLLRLAKTDYIGWRNNANSANLLLAIDSNDNLTFNGSVLATASASGFIDTGFFVVDASDATKRMGVNAGGTTGTTSTLTFAQTANRAITFPDATTTLVGTDTTQTLTNKTLTSPAITTPTGIVKGDVGLGNVDNTSDATKNSASATLTNKTIASPVLTGTVTTPVTASRALVTGSSSELAVSATTATELGYVSGVTSAIQTQLDAKIPKSLTTTAGDMIYASGANTPARLPVGTNSQVLKVVAGTPTWANFSGGINYITDTDGSAIGSWTTYADAAGTSPVDGTGGSPSSTYTVSTDSSLRGTTNFLWTHSAANRQGEGFSYNFTIDPSDKGKVLQLSLEYKIASGTYADDDLQFWIYDVTNARLIQPAPYKLKNSGTIEKFAMEFQTSSDSTSYRLIGHVATSTATAYTIRFANWSLGPQAKLYGSAVTDWVSFTPTGSWSTNTTYTGKWRKVGDSMQVKAQISLTGAPTAATLTVNLPSGFTIDTTKMTNSTQYFGNVFGSAVGVNTATQISMDVAYNSSTSVVLTYQASVADAHANVVNATAPVTWANTNTIDIAFEVPISGWSSSQVMSSDADTRVVSARFSTSTARTINNTSPTIVYENVNKDSHGAYNASTGVYTVPVAGDYSIQSYFRTAGHAETVGNVMLSTVYVNGAYYSTITGIRASVTTSMPYELGGATTVMNLKAGDLLTFKTYSDTSTTLASGAPEANWISLSKISGPSQIMASDTMSALYTGQPTGTLTSSFNTATFPTKVKDSHTAYSSGAYTVQSSGQFDIFAQVGVDQTNTTSTSVIVSIFIDGVEKARDRQYSRVAGGFFLQPQVSLRNYPLLAGQVVTVRVYADGTSPTYSSNAESSRFSINRTGNY